MDADGEHSHAGADAAGDGRWTTFDRRLCPRNDKRDGVLQAGMTCYTAAVMERLCEGTSAP